MMMSYADEEPRLPTIHFKFSPAVIKNACARCYCFRDNARASLVSEDDTPTPYSDLDNKHACLHFQEPITSNGSDVIILAIQSRALRAKARSKSGSSVENLCWVVSPTSGKLLIAPQVHHNREDEEGVGDDDETETFFSVKSYFSHCSSGSGSDPKVWQRRSILEEFSHCEGWPFGLWRKAIVLPPLPRSPSDSWTWHKRNPVAKICTSYHLSTELDYSRERSGE